MGLLVLTDVVVSSYTIFGGFHADQNPALATDSVAGFKELVRTIFNERALQQQLLCFAFCLFVISTINCYLTLSFLGLYGVFAVQLLTLTIFWFSLLLNANAFIVEGASAHLVLFK